ncbi:uncharacterized protein LOC130776573 isoform X2 [Actinidia eriantha]|uniref:uncharacterized protein LOC130776573 isoform X2 n=1 Tax=Actinidia eriantha TaxID=165200 RepID=UPI002589C2D1|nr:uncharacterized protein LOC130776573 isoform X2 [Actinidia eriantha]
MAALFGQKYKSMALAETERSGCLILGSVDSYGHLIVSKLGNSGKAIWRTLTVKTSLKAYVFSITSRLWCRRGWMGRAVLQSKSMLSPAASAKALMYMTKIFTFRLYILYRSYIETYVPSHFHMRV